VRAEIISMADLAKYQKEIERFNSSYAKEAIKEPVNFWGLAGFAVAAAYTQSIIPLVIALICEIAYFFIVPNLPSYRQLVNDRERDRIRALNKSTREKLIKSFTPREREAVEYLRWQKDKIQENYKKFTGAKQLPTNLTTLDRRWEDFVDLLDIYRRRKQHLKSINRQAVHNQLSQAFRTVENTDDEKTKRIQQTNVEILKRRLSSFDELEKSVKLVEGQLQSIENFFGYLNDEIVTMSTPEKFSLLDFEQLSDSIAMTKQMLDATSDSVGALDAYNREMGNYELLPGSNS
jgi:HD-GYP domain-containing protein (c-di-GMP phosphodiesterase class II)